ncbi:MAG: response regulator, partial [Burkholderiaceae bacterium]|nr:response regulator [Burkholderiaceae bacterium]
RTPTELLRSDKADPRVLEIVRTATAAGESCRVTLLNRAKDGREYWIDTEIQPTRDADGTVIGFMEIATDITESKLAKEKLELMANRLGLATEGSNDGLWHLIDVKSGEEWWSPKFYTLLGYEPGEVKAGFETFKSLLHPSHREMTVQAMRDALSAKKHFDIEYLVCTKSGHYRWYRGRAKVFFNVFGAATQMAGSLQDIHEHKLAQQKVVESERFLRTITDGVPARVAYWTRAQHCAFANQASVDWFGRLRATVIGLSMRELLGAEIFSQAEPYVLRTLSGEAQEFEREELCADASVRHTLVQYVPDMSDGVVAGFFVLVSDISDRKRNEALLTGATQKAEQASLAKTQFVANISHDIRTPMNAVLGMLKALQQTTLTRQQRDYVAETDGAARLLLGLLNDILDFSKIEAGKMVLDLQPFRTERLLRDLSVILSANVGDKKLDVLFDIDPAVPHYLIGDNLRLLQVLINLGVNAIKFTEQGEAVLRVRVTEQRENAVLLEFSVRDSGIGIAPEHHRRIFEGFSQAEASTTRRYGGTGLGLAICQRLVAMMGGKLMLESTIGVGSNFYFCIELAVPEALANEPVSVPREETPVLRALIVDDNAKAREVLANMARSLGWQADVAASSAEAIALAQASTGAATPYGAVFVDSGMAEWETCQRVQESLVNAPSPLMITVTAHGHETHLRTGQDRRFLTNGHLVKPATASMLFDAVALARPDCGQQEVMERAKGAEQGPLRGMKILVVDDNRLNRQVARTLLSEAGAHIALANNGQEAVAAAVAANPPFDVVLMDIQLPVMDGYAATAEIQRQMMRNAPPIIAMTASAMSSDRETCLAAGMADHVGKPFELSQLIATLLRHTGRAAPSTTLPARDATPPQAPLTDAIRAGIDLQDALNRLGGNTDVYVRVAESFLSDLAAVPEQLATHLQQGQCLEARRLMHTIKGVAGTLGLKRLAVLAQEAELSLSDAPGAELQNRLIADVRHAARVASADIARTVERLTASASMDPVPASSDLSNGAELGPLLDELTGLLGNSDMRAVDVYARLQPTYTALLGKCAQPLDEAMSMLDFQQALAHCQALQRTFANSELP